MIAIKRSLGIVAIMLMVACHQGNKFPKGIEHVVVIGIDGMSVQGFLEAETPCMDSLLQNGAYSYQVRCVLPTVSAPNWNAMLCGAGPEATGVIDNSWERNIDKFPPVATSKNKIFPNIFSVIREQKPDAEIGCFSQWGYLVETMLEVECMNRYEACKNTREAAAKTAQYILEKKPDFVFVQMDDVDGAGHSKGHMSAEYLKTIQETDNDVRTIVNALKQAGMIDKTMIMIVSDHGGIFYAHGRNFYEELTTPIIYSGKGIKKGYHIKQQIYRYDVAADVAFALGLEAPQVWVGRAVKAAFEGFGEPDNLYKGPEILPPPAFVSKKISTVNGDLFVDTVAEVKIKIPMGVEGEIRFTTDGSVPTRESALYAEPFTLDKSAVVNAKIFSDKGESPMAGAQYRVVSSQAGNGLVYSFFHLPGTKKMPALKGLHPVATGICYEPGLKSPEITALKNQYKTHIGLCFEGWLQIDTAANYTFRIWSGGGYRLYVDSELLFSHPDPEGYSNSSASIKLEKGWIPVRLEYFNYENDDRLELYYEADNFPLILVPGQKFFREKG